MKKVTEHSGKQKEKKPILLSEAINRDIGKPGTTEREKFEAEVNKELSEE